MRVDLKKFLFVGFKKERDSFFRNAQDAGVVQFIDKSSVKVKEMPQDIIDLNNAIKVLRGLPAVEQEETTEYALANGLAKKILNLKHLKEKLEEEHRLTKIEISRIEVFGDFSLDDIDYIEKYGHRKIQFFCARKGFAETADLPNEVIYINSDHGLDYFIAIKPKLESFNSSSCAKTSDDLRSTEAFPSDEKVQVINKQPEQYEKMIEMHFDKSLGSLKARFEEVGREIHETEQRIKSYAKYNEFLHHAVIHQLNAYNLSASQNYVEFVMDGSLFAVEGWVPKNKTKELHAMADNMDVHCEEIAITPDDLVPTCLENQGLNRLGEDLIRIYDTPSNTDNDPSLWVFGFFALFFSFIIGDGGYGLIFLAIALYVRSKYTDIGATGKRFFQLVVILCGCVITWGVLTNSFFGINFDIDSPIRKVSVMNWLVEKKADYHIQHHDDTWKEWVVKYPELENVTDPHEYVSKAAKVENGQVTYELFGKFSDFILLELALLIGCVHIGISLIRYMNRNWSSLGWLLFLIGCYLYFPVYLEATSIIHYIFGVNFEEGGRQGIYLIFGGISLAVIIALFKYKFVGIFEAMTMIQIFADVLSYLRLYALALAGSILTATINEMSAGMFSIFAILLAIAGHIVNMVLSIMGGVIHGLRLNFLEWYHYSFEGGGKPFKPLRKLLSK